MMQKIAITGHRTIKNVSEVRAEIKKVLQSMIVESKELMGLSALAAGADTIFAEEIIKLGISIKYILPFPLIEYQKDFTAKRSFIKLHNLIEANPIKYDVILDKIPASLNERKNAYFEVGKELVDECDILIGVWDGQPANGKGGTAEIVQYAKRINKQVIIIKANQ